jgi:predicted alpha/beta hydrolase
MGVYDLPAVIDYTLHYTKQKSLYYVGHSMGSTMFYVLMSMKPEYNAKIQHMVALAPVAFLRNTRSLFAVATQFLPKGVSLEILKGNSYNVTKGLEGFPSHEHCNWHNRWVDVLCYVTPRL